MKNRFKKIVKLNLWLALANILFTVYVKIFSGSFFSELSKLIDENGYRSVLFGNGRLTIIFGIVSLLVFILSFILIIAFGFKKISKIEFIYPAYNVIWNIGYFFLFPLITCWLIPIDCVLWMDAVYPYEIIFNIAAVGLVGYSLYQYKKK